MGTLDVRQALNRLFHDSDWMFKIGIGGMLNAICLVLALGSPFSAPVIIALMALNNGYVLRVARLQLSDPESNLPPWNNWLELFISGTTWMVIQAGFYLALLSVLTICLLVGQNTGAIKISSSHFLPWALATCLAATLTSLIVNCSIRFLSVNFAGQERIPAGFALGELCRRLACCPARFALVWLLSIGIKWAALLLPALTVVGIFLIPSTLFIAEIIGISLAAQTWQAADSKQAIV